MVQALTSEIGRDLIASECMKLPKCKMETRILN